MQRALLLPVALAATVGASVAVVRLAARGRVYAEQDVPDRPVALVLGAQVYPDGTPSRFLLARLELARRLYHARRVEQIIVSGDSQAPEWDEPGAMRRHLLDTGVPDSAIVVDPAGFDTYESCLRAKLVYGTSALTIVTQRYHLPRAVGTARLLGLDAVGVGDRTVQWVYDGGRPRRSRAWRRGAVRDQVACVKTMLDLISRRRPDPGATAAPPRGARRR